MRATRMISFVYFGQYKKSARVLRMRDDCGIWPTWLLMTGKTRAAASNIVTCAAECCRVADSGNSA